MDYTGAMQEVLSAYKSAQQLATTATTATQTQTQASTAAREVVSVTGESSMIYLAGGIAVGFIVGVAVVALMMRKRQKA
jgi:hypothetical protein